MTNVTARIDDKGGVNSHANVETNSLSGSISQDSRDDKPGFFSRAWNKFAKAVGLDSDRIVTEEDRRRAHLQA